MTIRLYSYWRSSAAYRVRIALNLKGIDYEVVPVSLAPGVAAHRDAAYRDRNPQMLVPFLEDGDVAIGQSMAIFEYLEETVPEPPLLPASPAGRARARALANIVCCDIHPLNNLRVLQYLGDPLEASREERDAWYAHWVTEGFRAIEALLADRSRRGPFAMGGDVTLVDVCLVPQVYNARRFDVPLAQFPTIVAISDACSALPAFADAAPENQPDRT